jgi:hypothetical protein
MTTMEVVAEAYSMQNMSAPETGRLAFTLLADWEALLDLLKGTRKGSGWSWSRT